MAEYYQRADVFIPGGSHSPSDLSLEATSYTYPGTDTSLVGVQLAEPVSSPQFPQSGIRLILTGEIPHAGEVAAQMVRRYGATSVESLQPK